MQPNSGQWGQNPQLAHGQPPQPQIIGQQIMVGEAQSTNATIGLILGILGIIGSFFYGIGCLCGTIGLIITYGAKKITDLNPMHPDKGTVKAALITNWIAVILAILMLITVALAGIMYVWAASLADEPYVSSNNSSYTAEDAADDANDATGADDTLIKMQLMSGDTLAWAFVDITLSVGDNVYTCSVAAGDDCVISQQDGDNDNAWEIGEYIFLSEADAEICSSSGCMVDIFVTSSGNTVAGDQAVIVN